MSAPWPETLGRTPLRWWSQAWRLTLAAALGVVNWGFTLYGATLMFGDAIPPGRSALLLLDAVVGVGCLVFAAYRRRFPLAATLIVVAASGVSSMSGGAELLSVVSLGTRRRWQDVPAVVVVNLCATYAMDRLWPSVEPMAVGWLLGVSALATVTLLAVGWYIGARRDLVVSLRERAATLEREQAARVVAARSHERAAIAREMHDVLAHRISLVAMHAGALSYRTDLDAAERARVAGIIETNSHLALSDLRDVLGVLRDPCPSAEFAATSTGVGAEIAESTMAHAVDGPGHPASRIAPPQPTLGDLPQLVDDNRRAGVHITWEQDVPCDPPTTLARHAYRIVQEALTNARKHAPGHPVVMRIAGSPGANLQVYVSNSLPDMPPCGRGTPPGAGAGLVGMAERADLAGGHLTTGPTSDGRFTVDAHLPWPAKDGF